METAEAFDVILFEGEMDSEHKPAWRNPKTMELDPTFYEGMVLIIHGTGERSLFEIYHYLGVEIWDLQETYLEDNYVRNRR
jgi:hypothetical protein